MTRLNLLPPQELSDQHLLAEYREIPRILKNKVNISDAPEKYCLGKGHVKFARKHLLFTLERYKLVCLEMSYRGFVVNFPYSDMEKYLIAQGYMDENGVWTDSQYTNYTPTADDIALNSQRLNEKIAQKPDWYRWSNP